MAKSMKITEILDYLANENVKKEVLDEFHKEFPPSNNNEVIVMEPIFKDSKMQYVCKCRKCGNIFFLAKNYIWKTTCPACKKEYPATQFNDAKELERYALIKKINDVFCIFIISRSYKIASDETEYFIEGRENKHLDNPIECLDDVFYHNFFFSEKLGFREERNSRKKYVNEWHRSPLCADEYIVHNDAQKELLLLLNKFEGETLSEKLCAYNKLLDSQVKKSKEVKSVDTDDLVSTLDENSFKKKIAESDGNFVFGSISDIDMENVRWKVKCSCGNIFSGISENGGSYIAPQYVYDFPISTKCPCCNKTIDINIRRGDDKRISFVSYFEPFDEGVVERCFSMTNYLDAEKPLEIRELQRIFFYPNKYVIVRESNGIWKKYRTPEANTCFPLLLNTKKELEDIINNSFLARTGLLQAWGLGEYADFKIEETGYISKNSYLLTWYAYPWLELLEKSKLTKVVSDYLRFGVSPVIDGTATDVYSLLGISKNAFKIARHYNFDKAGISVVNKCCKLQPNFSINDWLELKDIFKRETVISRFCDICERTDTTIKRLKDYLQSCYDNQCIEKPEALDCWGDYYNMAKAVGFNLADSAIKFPNSLKKEHDKALFAYRVVQNEIKKKQFIENSKKNKKYEFENEEFKVIVPMSPEEVVREGQLLSHCVSSYVSRIEEGSTCICFIRKKDAIDTPFFTCEIYANSLYQVKGYCNKYPNKRKDKELVEFINEWTKEKVLTQEYMAH